MAVGSGEIGIYGILRNDTTEGTIAKTDQLYDDDMALYQDAINKKFQEDLENNTSDLEDKIDQLQQDLNEEINNRTSADNDLQNNINEEAQLREESDNSIISDLQKEISDRTDADQTLQTNINNVEATLNQAVTDLEEKHDQDIEAVKSEYTELINTEKSERENADSTLQEAIDNISSSTGDDIDEINNQITEINSTITEIQADLDTKLDKSEKGATGGVAPLGDDGFVPSAYLPSYVDDVLEYADYSSLPATGETGKIYVTLDTNLTYRWSGSGYIEISASLALGETSSTAYAGDKGAATTATVDSLPDTVVSSIARSITATAASTTVSISVNGTVTQYTKSNGSYSSGTSSPSGSAVIPAATTSAAGVMSAEDKDKLDSIESISNDYIDEICV